MPKIRSAPTSARTRPRRSGPAHADVPPSTGSEPSRPGRDTQHRRLLTGMAYHSGIGDADSCLTALAVLSASRALRRALDRDFGAMEMSECSFVALVTLYALEPAACTPDALAHDAEVNPDAMRGVLDFLELRGWIGREEAGTPDQPGRVHITAQGIEITIQAVHRFLEISATLAADLGADEHSAAIKACAQIVRAAAGPRHPRVRSESQP